MTFSAELITFTYYIQTLAFSMYSAMDLANSMCSKSSFHSKGLHDDSFFTFSQSDYRQLKYRDCLDFDTLNSPDCRASKIIGDDINLEP